MAFRWGIAGTGGIARAMAGTLAAMNEAEVVAVTSSDPGRAQAFAAEHRIEFFSAPHAAFGADLDAVYVATTNDLHHQVTLDLLDRGIPILCEKPLALDLAQAEEMASAAGRSSALLMEAMWMVFQPSHRKVLELVADGRVGEVRYVTADFGFVAGKPRVFRKDLGGGGLLDLGVYVLTFAAEAAGPIESIKSEAQLRDGVDVQLGMTARHESGAISLLGTSTIADTDGAAMVAGPEGRLVIDAPFHHSPRVSHWVRGEMVEAWDTSYDGHGFRFEVEHFHECLERGLPDSPVRPISKTLAIMGLMDDVRSQIGVTWD